MSEYEIEPIPGLPGDLPPGERILWQGKPEWRMLARTAFHTRIVAGYFVLLSVWAVADAMVNQSGATGAAMTILAGLAAVGLLHLLAWGSARTTIYTLTNRRIVMRIGMAVPKCINLPLTEIRSVDLALRSGGSGDLPLTLVGSPKLGFLALWPHARAWRIARPQPMLRAVADAQDVARLIARTCLAANPAGAIADPSMPAESTPQFGEAVAA